jgi:hypothetical protein
MLILAVVLIALDALDMSSPGAIVAKAPFTYAISDIQAHVPHLSLGQRSGTGA